jgi:hypothetical protein
MEYFPVAVFALIFFIVPVVGGIAFGWFWRDRRARNESPGEPSAPVTRHQRH